MQAFNASACGGREARGAGRCAATATCAAQARAARGALTSAYCLLIASHPKAKHHTRLREVARPGNYNPSAGEGTTWESVMRETRFGARLAQACASSLRGLRATLSSDVAVDLGTEATRLFARGRGLLLEEPTAIAYSLHTGAVVGVGEAAKLLVGRESRSVRVVRPVRHGQVSDSDAAAQMLQHFLNRALPRRGLWKPHLLLVIPSGTTELDRYGFEDAAYRAGAGHVTLLEQPLALAAADHFACGRRRMLMTVDFGAGKTNAAVVCERGVICSLTVRVGMDDLDRAIQQHLRQTRGLEIGETTAAVLKHELGAVGEQATAAEAEIGARRAASGLPEKALVTHAEVEMATKPLVRELVGVVRAVLDQCPPEAAGDLFEAGVLLAGGGALLAGMCELIAAETGLAVRRAPNPLTASVFGAGYLLGPAAPALATPASSERALPGTTLFPEGALYTLADGRTATTELSSAH